MKPSLTALAETAPIARLSSDELWHRGRRRRARAQVTSAVAAALVVVVATLALPHWRPEPPASNRLTLPSRLEPPPFWHKTFEGSPNGPLLLSFRLDGDPLNSMSDRVTEVYVGRGGGYRLDRRADFNKLSPDGRYLASWGEVVDLTTGRTVHESSQYDVPTAWAPDSRTLLISNNFGSDGPDYLSLLDVTTGKQRRLNANLGAYEGAISPDGRLAALVVNSDTGRPQIHVIDLESGAEILKRDLDSNQRLAGPAAFTPDGASIVISSGHSLEYVPATAWGPARPGPARSSIDQYIGYLVGWRDGLPVMTVYGLDAPDEAAVAKLHPDGRYETLLRVVSKSLTVPADVVATADFGGAPVGPGFEPAPWAAASIICLITMVVAILAIILFRRQRPARLDVIHKESIRS